LEFTNPTPGDLSPGNAREGEGDDEMPGKIYPGGRKVAGWERSRNRCGLWVETTRLAYIGKEKGRNHWHWSIDMKPYTCGTADSLTDAKNAVAAELARIQQEPTHADH